MALLLEVLNLEISDFNEEMHCSTAFDPIAETMNDPEVQKEINDVKVVTFPPGLDQGMVKQRMGAILNGIIPQPRKAHTIENLVVSYLSTRAESLCSLPITSRYSSPKIVSTSYHCAASSP